MLQEELDAQVLVVKPFFVLKRLVLVLLSVVYLWLVRYAPLQRHASAGHSSSTRKIFTSAALANYVNDSVSLQ